jgi:hypothetical protein
MTDFVKVLKGECAFISNINYVDKAIGGKTGDL